MTDIPKRIPGTADSMDLSKLDFETVNLLVNSDIEFIYDWNGKDWEANVAFGMYEE